MILNLYKCLLLTTIAVLTFGCNKENSESYEDLIIGKWEWLESVSSWTGLIRNPHTEGYSQAIEFSAKGIMKMYQDDTLMDSTNYRIEQYSGESDKYELIYSRDLRVHISFVKDTLILNAAYVDGPVTSYVRIQ